MSDPVVSSPDAERLAKKIKATAFDAERLMQRIVLIALGHSQKRTPVRTGTLRRSETTRVEAGGMRGWLGTNVKYAAFVHEGTRHMAARPFFEEGIADSRAEIDRELARAGDAHMQKVAE